MNKIYLNLRKVSKNGFNGVVVAICLLFACITLSYVLFHNPHQDLHEQIFATAENIRSYYRDKPAYWKLSTDSAREDNLIAKDLLHYDDSELKIGQGEDGEVSMPTDSSFDIVLKKLNKSACINLSELAINRTQQLGLQKIAVINEDNHTDFLWGDEQHPLPIKRYTTRSICAADGNTIIWTFQ